MSGADANVPIRRRSISTDLNLTSMDCGYRSALGGKLRVMTSPSENRRQSAPGATEPPMAPLPADLVAPAPDPAPPSSDLLPPTPIEQPPVAHRPSVPRTVTSAVWFGVWAGVAALILLIIFVAQNTAGVEINFLWMHGRIPLALGLLIAGVCGALVAMAVAAVRIIQLRRLVHRGR
jgi:uncharacterized integral membrane protein